jgi:hypothetical protein
MIFCDGVGIGSRDPAVNPFFRARLPTLCGLLDGELPSLHHRRARTDHTTLLPLDANLGMPGLPQSGTGQTALFTGENGARLIGKHFGPYLYSTLKPVVAAKHVFRRLVERGGRARFANAFPQRFFEYVERRPGRLSVTTFACLHTGLPLMREQDLRSGGAVSADLTGEGWHALGYPDMPVIEPAEAGRRLVRLLGRHDFVLFEYWKTDHAGHSGSMAEAVASLENLDALLAGVLETLDRRQHLLLLTSDHGNLEDMSTKTHTRHPVPALMHGHRQAELAAVLETGPDPGDLTHITPALMQLFARSL